MKKIILLFLLAIIIACKENRIVKTVLQDRIEDKSFFRFYFPDTLNVNETYKGVILYESELDTMTTKIHQVGDTMRLLKFYLKQNKQRISDNFKHILKDSSSRQFPSNSKDTIHFEYSFSKSGNYYLEGVLEDEVYYATLNEDKPIEILRIYNHIIHPIFVTNNNDTLFLNSE